MAGSRRGGNPDDPAADGTATIEPWVATLRAHMMPQGVEQALADAELALERLAPGSFWMPSAFLARGVAHAALCATDRATDDFRETVVRTLALDGVEEVYLAEAQLALLAAKQGAWGEAAERARSAQGVVDEAGLGGYASSAIAHAATARIAVHEARTRTAGRRWHVPPPAANARPRHPVVVHPSRARARPRPPRARRSRGRPRTVLRETEQVLTPRPTWASSWRKRGELRERLAATTGPAGAWAMSLTGAELRLLPYLATHLTIPEIATRLFISRNTVKTEAVSIYRKLSASSRSEAIERAVEVGLLESSIYPPPANLTQSG